MAKAHYSPASFVLVSGAERGGKSVGAAMEGIAWVGFSELIWVGGKRYEDALKEYGLLGNALVSLEIAEPNFPESTKQPSILKTKPLWFPCGVPYRHHHTVSTRTFHDIYSTIIKDEPDLLLLVEAGQITDNPIEKIRLRLSTRRGRLFASGTLEQAAAWFEDTLVSWRDGADPMHFAISMPLSENVKDFPGGEDNPELRMLRRTLRPATYAERVRGIPGASEELVFERTFIAGERPFNARPCPFVELDEFGRTQDVTVTVDPGTRPSFYAVNACQKHDRSWFAVDELVAQDTSHEEMIRDAMLRPWWRNVTRIVMDPWANQRGMGGTHTPREIWEAETGLPVVMPDPAPKPKDIFDRYLWYLFTPPGGDCHFFFDPDSCPHLLAEWRRWRHPKDPNGRLNTREFSKRWCDCIKGIGYLLVLDFQENFWEKNWGNYGRPVVADWRFR